MMKVSLLSCLAFCALFSDNKAQAQDNCTTPAELVTQGPDHQWMPCDSFTALYINNNIEELSFSDLPPPSDDHLVNLAVQAFVYRRDTLEDDRSIDHLISAIPLLKELDEERYYIYSTYIMLSHAEKEGGKDTTGAINPAIYGATREIRLKTPDEVLCFAQADIASLPIEEILSSPVYTDCVSK